VTKEGSSEPDRPTRAIIVGAGLMGRYHARASMAAGASIVAVVDWDAQAAASLSAQFGSAKPFDDLAEVLEADQADVLHICTPAETHVQFARMAADAGLHALIEKPLAANAQETRLVLDRFAAAERIACPTHQYAFQRSVTSAVESFQRLGRVRHIAFDICSAGADRGGMDLDELVGEILPHPLAMIQKLLPTSDVGALEWSCFRTGPGEWQMFAQSGDVAVTIAMSMSGRPTRFRTTVTADRGTVELDNFHDFAVLLPGNVSRAQKITAPFIRDGLGLFAAGRNLVSRAMRSELAYPGLSTLVDAFYRAVREPQTVSPPITAEQTIAVAAARDRLIELSGSD
jgi:predicted dehydrogenase